MSDQEDAKAILDKIIAMASLAPGWDGYDAPAMDVASVASATAFVNRLGEYCRSRSIRLPVPFVGPGSSGRAHLSWTGGATEGRELYLAFEPSGGAEYLRVWPDKDTKDGEAEDGGFAGDDDLILHAKWLVGVSDRRS